MSYSSCIKCGRILYSVGENKAMYCGNCSNQSSVMNQPTKPATIKDVETITKKLEVLNRKLKYDYSDRMYRKICLIDTLENKLKLIKGEQL